MRKVETQLAPRRLVSATDAQYCIQGATCATQDMLSLMHFRELYQTKQTKKSLDGPKSPERLVFTKPPHKTLVLSMSTKGIRTLAAPPTHTEQWQGFV